MASLVSCNQIDKAYSGKVLFTKLTLGIEDRDKLTILGPNGAGKSTLMKILAGLDEPDAGQVASRRLCRKSFLSQDLGFSQTTSVEALFAAKARELKLPKEDAEVESARLMSVIGISDPTKKIADFSGGWQKRIAIGLALLQGPDLLFLDEPTNHLDLEGCLWLEQILQNSQFAWVLISHDRYFIEKTTQTFLEINPLYAKSYFSFKGSYQEFLQKRQEQFAAERSEADSLANKVRREDAWLQRGPKARSTKATARIDQAMEMKEKLAQDQRRLRQTNKADIEFIQTEARSKKLMTIKGVSKSFGDRKIIENFNLTLMNGDRIGLLGANGSGKSTLLKLMTKDIEGDVGSVEYKHDLRVLYFDQQRNQLDLQWTLRRALCDSGDSVIFEGRSIHVVSWAKKFQLQPGQLDTKLIQLSGGEQARVLIARLMLQPADVLLLDEPTNDLDIDTLEVLEESLGQFKGAIVLITHDRYMLKNLCQQLIYLDGQGHHEFFTGYDQWESLQQQTPDKKYIKPTSNSYDDRKTTKKKKLSYMDQRDLDTMESQIELWETKLSQSQEKLADPRIATDEQKAREVYSEFEEAKEAIERLYTRWAELEALQVES